MLLIQKFIKENQDNWQEKLKELHNVGTKSKVINGREYYMLKYDFIAADFTNPMVRECRGLILNQDFEVKSLPFYKFGNYGESYADNIDWSTAKVMEKVDGSLIHMWLDDTKTELVISTSGNISAKDSPINGSSLTFFDKVTEAVMKMDRAKAYEYVQNGHCLTFELVSPETQVVVPHSETKLVHLGTRRLSDLQEIEVDLGIEKPKQYSLSSLEECIEATKTMPWTEEGYVAVDANYNRIKIKSPAYVAVHHLSGTLTVTSKYHHFVDVICKGEVDELLNYFGNLEVRVREVEGVLKKIEEGINAVVEKYLTMHFETQKEVALFFQQEAPMYTGYLFELHKKGLEMAPFKEWLVGKGDTFKDNLIERSIKNFNA